jgi:cytidylate kinase
MKNVITIDGPSGVGKSTVSKILAESLGYRYLDTGALYRAVAWKVKHEGVDPDDEESLCRILEKTEIVFDGGTIKVNGFNVTAQIRDPEIGELSSSVSAKPVVREKLYAIQRDFGLQGNAVIEGRDIGATILPEAEHKFFLDASVNERAKRRHKELTEKAVNIALDDTIRAMQKRDKRDSTRSSSPLRRTQDMVYIDTSTLTIKEVVSKILDQVALSG